MKKTIFGITGIIFLIIYYEILHQLNGAFIEEN